MNRRPLEERAGAPYFLLGSLWGILVLVRFTLPSFRGLGEWTRFLDPGPVTPGAPGLLAALGQNAGITLAALAILGVTWTLGRKVRALLGLDFQEAWVRAAMEFLFGTLVMGSFWVGAGFCGLWFPVIGLCLGIPLLVWALRELWRTHWKEGTWSFRVSLPREAGAIFLGLTALLYFCFAILQDLAPEIFYDSMVYHLAVPAAWIDRHAITDLPANFFSNYPFGAEVYFLNGLLVQGTETAKMLHLAAFVVAALLAGGWAREMGGTRAGWLTFGMVLTFPLLALCVWTTQVEGFLVLPCLAALYSLDRWTRGEGARWGFLAGLTSGAALSVKYTAFPFLAAALLVLAFQRPLFRIPWKEWVQVLLGGSLVLGPWLVKNLAYAGNPFFPYLMDLFPGRRIPGYHKLLEEQMVRLTSGPLDWLKLPWTLTMANPDSYVFVGPLALALGPLLLLFRFRHPTLRFLSALIPLLFLAGLSLTHILKFSAPAFLVLYLVLGVALGGCRYAIVGKAAAWAAGLAALVCFTYLASISHRHYDAAGVWLGRTTRDDYLQAPKRISPYQTLARWTSQHLPKDDRLLVVGGHRGLYLDQEFINQSAFDEQILFRAVRKGGGAEGILRSLEQEGVDALLVEVPEGVNVVDYRHYELTPKEWAELDVFIQQGTEPLYLKDFQGVYRLRGRLGPAPAKEVPNLLLYLSQPAAKFVLCAQKGDLEGAKVQLENTRRLFPFSSHWKEQARIFPGTPEGK